MNLPRDISFGTYSSYQPPAPPLGYIVAYTPEQLTEIIKDQYQFGPPSSMYQCPVSHYSPSASPKKTVTARHSLLAGPLPQKILWQQQLHQNTEDGRWLHREDDNLVPGERKSTSTISTDEDSLGSFKDSPFNVSLSMTDFRLHQLSDDSSSALDAVKRNSADLSSHNMESVRLRDALYSATTSVVRAIMEMTKGVQQQADADQYVHYVKSVGLQLKEMLKCIDEEIPLLPETSHSVVQLGHKALSSDLAELVDAMKLARQYSATILAGEYSRGMLQAAHTLAVDTKNLYDTVELAHRQQIQSVSTSEKLVPLVTAPSSVAPSDESPKSIIDALLSQHQESNVCSNDDTEEIVQANRSSGEISSGMCEEMSGRLSKLSSGVSSGLSSGISDGGISSGLSDAGMSVPPCNTLLMQRASGLTGTLLLNSDSDEDSDEEGMDVALGNADVDPLSSEADRCLEAETDENLSDDDEDNKPVIVKNPASLSHLDVLDQLSEMLARNIVFASCASGETNCEPKDGMPLSKRCPSTKQDTDCLS